MSSKIPYHLRQTLRMGGVEKNGKLEPRVANGCCGLPSLMRDAMHVEKHGRGVEDARRMLDTFASVGVNAFDVTETDIDGHKLGFRSHQRFEQLQPSIPYLIQSAVERQQNIIVRPRGRRPSWCNWTMSVESGWGA